jgi:hypothetical protein
MAVEQRLCDVTECGCAGRIVQVGEQPSVAASLPRSPPGTCASPDAERRPAATSESLRRTDDGYHADRVERYLRVTVEVPGGSIEAGLERKLGEPLYVLRAELRTVIAVCHAAVAGRHDGVLPICDDTAAPVTDLIESRLRVTWPDRAWFVEVWSGAEALTQVYSPWGMPIRDPK